KGPTNRLASSYPANRQENAPATRANNPTDYEQDPGSSRSRPHPNLGLCMDQAQGRPRQDGDSILRILAMVRSGRSRQAVQSRSQQGDAIQLCILPTQREWRHMGHRWLGRFHRLFGEQVGIPRGTREYGTPEVRPKKACAARKIRTGLIQLAHDAGVEVYPSIGGWTLSHSFPKLAANSTSRVNFANNCVKLIEAYDFDGIDIDWEYPGYVDHNGTVEDTVNYSLFLEEIRKALDALGEKKGQTYGLTAALPCGPDLIDNIQIDVVNDYLDELNLMTYDFHGAWDEKTGANAPLYDMKRSPNLSVHSCVELWKKAGANIGLPFYGRSVAGDGLTGFGQKHLGKADLSTWFDDDGSPQYFNILKGLATFTTVWDEQTRTVFAYSSTGFVCTTTTGHM
ncbi:hypothetical protein ACHAXA_003902, partial [Cyclostephanos tholiformis]